MSDETDRLAELLSLMQAAKPGLTWNDCLDEIFRRGTLATEQLYRARERND
jgi:hypothetical protein